MPTLSSSLVAATVTASAIPPTISGGTSPTTSIAAGTASATAAAAAPSVTRVLAAGVAQATASAVAPAIAHGGLTAGVAAAQAQATAPGVLRVLAAGVASAQATAVAVSINATYVVGAAQATAVAVAPSVLRVVRAGAAEALARAYAPDLTSSGTAQLSPGVAPAYAVAVAPALTRTLAAGAASATAAAVAPAVSVVGTTSRAAGTASAQSRAVAPSLRRVLAAGAAGAQAAATAPTLTQVLIPEVADVLALAVAPAATAVGTAVRAAGAAQAQALAVAPAISRALAAGVAQAQAEAVAPELTSTPTILDWPTGGRGIGPEAEGDQYPFDDLALHPSGTLRGILAEVYLALEPGVVNAHPGPYRVAALYGFDKALNPDLVSPSEVASPGGHDVVIRDANDAVVFDSRAAAVEGSGGLSRSRRYDRRLYWHEWALPGTGYLRVIQHAAWPTPEDRPTIPAALELDAPDGRLDWRCTAFITPRVDAFSVPESVGVAPAGWTFRGGYNTTFAPSTRVDGLRTYRRATVRVEAGTGAGRAPGCTESSGVPLASLGGATPDRRGNLMLDAADCYWARPVVTGNSTAADLVAGALQLGNDCGPCTRCEDMEAFQADQLALWDRAAAVYARLDAARARLVELAATWAEQKECRESQPVSIAALGHDGNVVDAAFVVCNHTDLCLRDVELRIEAETNSEHVTAEVLPASVTVSGSGRGQTPYELTPDTVVILEGGVAYLAYFDTLPAQGRGVLKMRMLLEADADGPRMVKLAARSGVLRGGELADPVTKLVPVRS